MVKEVRDCISTIAFVKLLIACSKEDGLCVLYALMTKGRQIRFSVCRSQHGQNKEHEKMSNDLLHEYKRHMTVTMSIAFLSRTFSIRRDWSYTVSLPSLEFNLFHPVRVTASVVEGTTIIFNLCCECNCSIFCVSVASCDNVTTAP
jgi:hypothetical protein